MRQKQLVMDPGLIKAEGQRILQTDQRMRISFTAVLRHPQLRMHPAIVRKETDPGHEIAKRSLMIMKLIAQPAHIRKIKRLFKRMTIKTPQIRERFFITPGIRKGVERFPIIHHSHCPFTSAARRGCRRQIK